MIKKLLASILFINLLAISAIFAQCTPNLSITIPGIYPDSATGLAQGYVGTPYSEVVQARIPADTTYLGILVPITSFSIDSIVGLPPSFSYACNPSNCVFPGGSNGCILISGNPTVSGTYNLDVYGNATGIFLGSTLTLPFLLDYYQIVINPFSPTGVPQNSNYTFTVSQNEPNPFSNFTSINFTSPVAGKAELKIFNMIGNEIYSGDYRVNTGKNAIRIDAKDFDSGIYMYTLSMGNFMATKRMVISKK